MKILYQYQFYLTLSLASLAVGAVFSFFHVDTNAEMLALVAFILFIISVVVIASEEFFSVRPHVLKKLKSLPRIWKK